MLTGIFLMENGRVMETGTHAELVAKNGAYAKLYAMQFADDEGNEPAAVAQACILGFASKHLAQTGSRSRIKLAYCTIYSACVAYWALANRKWRYRRRIGQGR